MADDNKAFVNKIKGDIKLDAANRFIKRLEQHNKQLQLRLDNSACLLISKQREILSQKKTMFIDEGKRERLVFIAVYSSIILFVAGLFLGVASC